MSHLPLRKRKLSFKFFTSAHSLALAFFLALASNLFSQNVGINTTTPVAGLHVVSNDGLLIESEYGVGSLPLSGFGTRHLFNPKTGAFRTGRLTEDDGGIYEDWWNFLNVGDYSIVAGVDSKASGYASSAFGHKNQALGLTAFAAGGRNNIANGNMSFVTGFENTAQSYLEFVIGQDATVYSPNGLNGFDLADRLFVVGNGINSSSRHNAFTIMKNGNIGVGTDAPQSLFDVDGTATMDKAFINDSLQSNYFRMSNGAATGYLLQSDANGNAQWTSPSTLFSDDWSTAGNDIYNGNTGNVGIGTNSPSAKLHVVGNMILDAGHLSFENTGSSVFIGRYAGENDDLSANSNVFIGETAGQQNVDGTNNIAIGADALQQGVSAGNNIGIGKSALQSNLTGTGNIAMGTFAMSSTTSGSNNLALGFLSLNQNTSGSSNVGIGIGTLTANTSGSGNLAEGLSALHNNTTGISNIGIGEYALFLNTIGSQNVSIGQHTLESGMTGVNNVALGHYAGNNNSGNANTLIGFESGKMNNGSSNVFLGYQAGFFESGSNKLYINNSNSVTPLIYGDFQNNKVIINDSLQSKYLSMTDGAANGYLLISDANGQASWTNPATIFTNYWTANGSNIYNANAANIGIGTMNPLDKLHVVGSLRVEGGRINFTNTGYGTFVGHNAGLSDFTSLQNANTFIGEQAGTNTNTGAENTAVGTFAFQSNVSGSQNAAMGHSTLLNNTTGVHNAALGYSALRDNSSGSNNVAVGYYSLNHNNATGNIGLGESAGNDNVNGTGNVFLGQSAGHNVLGSSNVMLGHEAGYNETGSNKLYIDNSNTSTPLLYGDFDNNKLVINDSLQSKFFHATMNAEVEGDLNMNNGKILFTNTGESVFIGEGAGDNDDLSDNSNVFIGQNAGQSTTTGADNIAIGSSVLLNNTTGNANIGLGEFSLFNNSTGGINVAIGQHALEANQTGEDNVAIGFFTGLNSTGNDNTFIGHEAGFSTTGSGNVFLGRKAGFDETGSNKLYIDNSETATPLIYGDFSTNKVTINDSLATKNFIATQTAQVNGTLKINAGKISFTNTGQSVFIGDEAGAADDLSNNNSVFIGHQAGKSNTTGTNNIAIGAFALDAATNSNYNIALGQDVLGDASLTGGYNTGIGNYSLTNITSGGDNIAIGQNTGGTINTGTRNIAIGNYSFDNATTGGYNTTIGYESLSNNVSGNSNTTLGYYAGNAVTGNNNVIIGFNAGLLTSGSNNVMIGSEAGSNETGSNKLYIDNSPTSAPLIQGDFSANEVTINDSLTVNKELSVGTSVANSTLEVNGSVAAKFKTPLVAGTTNPDGTGMVWRYTSTSGSGNITLPAASTCANRMYVIINQTGTPRTITSYHDLTTTPVNSINSSVALWLMSDGVEWWQIK